MATITMSIEEVEWLSTLIDNTPWDEGIDKDYRPSVESKLNAILTDR